MVSNSIGERWFCDRYETKQKLATLVMHGDVPHIHELEKDVICSTVVLILEVRWYQVTYGEDVHVIDFKSNECTCKA